MKRIVSFIILLFMVSMFSGCAYYRYGDQSFSTPDQALEYQKEKNKEIIDSLVKRESINKKVLVIIPDKKTIAKYGIRRGRIAPPEVVEYVSNSMYVDIKLLVDSLKQTKSFTLVDIKHMVFPEKSYGTYIAEYDAVVFYHIESVDAQHWYIVSEREGAKQQKIIVDPDLKEPKERIDSWIDQVQRYTKNM